MFYGIELIKFGGNELHDKLYELIKDKWRQEKLSKEWEEEITVTIHIKEDQTKWKNHKAVTLRSNKL